MNVNSRKLAGELAQTLDGKDKQGKNNKIEASAWNQFVSDKGGKQISNYICIDAAIKSLIVYLCRQAKASGRLISELGQEWINTLKNPTIEENSVDANAEKKIKNKTAAKKSVSDNLSKKVDTSYSKLTREKALVKAKNDSRLERLDGGDGWSISENSFVTDIPYARKFTGAILSFVSSLIGENIVVTSALGTRGTKGKRTPHKISENYCTHHNAENPKLDIRTNGNSKKLRKKLIATGLFSRVSAEPDHLDVQIKNEVYLAFEKGFNLSNILACAKRNDFSMLSA
jgi:hypothetical protein